jgi:hypothetical protein
MSLLYVIAFVFCDVPLRIFNSLFSIIMFILFLYNNNNRRVQCVRRTGRCASCPFRQRRSDDVVVIVIIVIVIIVVFIGAGAVVVVAAGYAAAHARYRCHQRQ